MRLMRAIRLLLIIAIGLLESGILSAQTSLLAGKSNKGIVVYLKGEIPRAKSLRLVRYSMNGDSSSIALPGMATNLKRFRENEDHLPPALNYIYQIPDSTARRLLKDAVTAKSFSQISYSNNPAVLFGMGYAAYDSSADPQKVQKYAVYAGSALIAQTQKVKATGFQTNTFIASWSGTTDKSNPRLIWRTSLNWEDSSVSFLVYRARAFTLPFRQINTLRGYNISGDTLFLMARDTTLHTPGAFHYIIRLVDKFGNLSAPSEYAEATGARQSGLPFFSYTRATGTPDKPKLSVHWKLLGASLVRNIEIYRGQSFDGPFIKIAAVPPKDSVYTDDVQRLKESYFYYLKAIPLVAGDTAISATVTNISPFTAQAFPPKEIIVTPDSSGIAVSWTPFSGDELGFYVWRNKGPQTPLEKISYLIRNDTTLKRISFRDSSGTLRGNVRYGYAITSVGRGFGNSPFSDTLYARPWLKNPLESPAQTWLTALSSDSLLFAWSNLGSAVPDLKGYEVRITTNQNEPPHSALLKSFPAAQNYMHVSKEAAPRYAQVRAVDIFGNRSSWSTRATISALNYASTSPRYIECTDRPNGILVKWFTTDSSATQYVLYRLDEKGKKTTIPIRNFQTGKYLDTQTQKGSRYGYYLESEYAGSKKSKPTEVVVVKKEL